MNRDVLKLLLKQAFGGTAPERRVVSRAAGDLADSGRFHADKGVRLTPQRIIENLAEAPEDSGLVDRWNWWIGALELAHGGYGEFLVREWADDARA